MGVLAFLCLLSTAQSPQDGAADASPAPATAAPPVVTEPAARPPEGKNAGSLDIRLRQLTDLLAASLQKLPGDVRAKKLAVLPLTDVGAGAKKASLGLITADTIAVNLRRDHNLFVVERSRLSEVLSEQSLTQSGLVDVKDTAKLGVLLDADAVVVGQVSDAGKDFLITARVVDVSSTRVLASEQITVPAKDLMTLSAESVVLRSKSDAVFRSLVIPGWGQSYNRQPVKSALFLGATAVSALVAALSAGTFIGLGIYYVTCNGDCVEGRKLGPVRNPIFTFENIRVALAPQAILIGSLFALVGALTWGLNVVDAYLSGTNG